MQGWSPKWSRRVSLEDACAAGFAGKRYAGALPRTLPRPLLRDPRAAGLPVIARMASVSGRAAASYPVHGSDVRNSFGAVLTVNFLGLSPLRTVSQCIGMDAGAPARARGDKTATAVAVRSFHR